MYTFDGRVRYSECDEHRNITLLSMINYLQDCTTFHSESIGRGIEYMHERGIAWLIAAWQIEVRRLPRFCDEIRVGTWCHTMSNTLASRNFVICDPAGEQMVRADSLWFVYDFAAGRPIRVPDDQLVYLTDEPRLDMPRTTRKLPVRGEGIAAPELVVGEQHLDTNRHVNNAQYLGMATSALSSVYDGETAVRTPDISRICVQYRQQARLGDTIVPVVHADDSAHTIDLTDGHGDSFAVVRLELR